MKNIDKLKIAIFYKEEYLKYVTALEKQNFYEATEQTQLDKALNQEENKILDIIYKGVTSKQYKLLSKKICKLYESTFKSKLKEKHKNILSFNAWKKTYEN